MIMRNTPETQPLASNDSKPRPGSPVGGGSISGGGGLQPRRPHRGRPLTWGLSLSLLFHLLLALFASRAWIPIRSDLGGSPESVRPDAISPEMRALRLEIIEGELEDEEIATPPDPEDEILRRIPLPVEPTAPGVETEGQEAEREPHDREAAPRRGLQPEMVDPRLWERVEAPPIPEPSDFEKARARVYARIQMLNDSLAAEGELARRGTDWTFTDKEGRRWGVSPDGLHLGGVTLPLPVRFDPPPDQAREARERASRAGEIEDHADRARVRGTFEEAVRATRKERDRARSARRDSTSTDE